MQTVLELKNISKEYPGVLALDDVNISFAQSEVHAIVGENGAGKSTLIKICTGAINPSAGEIILFNKIYKRLNPISSKESGISVIYQELNLINELSVAENIFLGEKAGKGWIIDRKYMNEKSGMLLKNLNLLIDPNKLVKNLTTGYQQLVEIAKALAKNTKILIMDEPTAPLTNSEVEILFGLIRKLKESGITIIYISHRLDEIFQISDRVSVLRDGKYIGIKNTQETTREELIRMMVGREINETYPVRKIQNNGNIIFSMKGISGNDLKDINFQLKKGEVLGFAGLIGSGRTKIAEFMFGVKKPVSGEMFLKNNRYKPKRPEDAIKLGIALVPEDRKRYGILINRSVKENITMPILKNISKFTIINQKTEKDIVNRYKKSLGIKVTSIDQLANSLSGGNQQKVVLAKWLAVKADIIILDEPTRGIDVGAKQEIYVLIDELIKQGKTLIIISSEMGELIGMSDRIIVLCEGEIVGELSKGEFSQETILNYASKNQLNGAHNEKNRI